MWCIVICMQELLLFSLWFLYIWFSCLLSRTFLRVLLTLPSGHKMRLQVITYVHWSHCNPLLIHSFPIFYNFSFSRSAYCNTLLNRFYWISIIFFFNVKNIIKSIGTYNHHLFIELSITFCRAFLCCWGRFEWKFNKRFNAEPLGIYNII